MDYRKVKNAGRKLEAVLFLVTLAVFAMIFLVFRGGGIWQNQEKVQPLSSGWYYMEDGVRKDITLPAEIPARDGEELLLYNETLSEDNIGMTVITTGAQYDLVIRLDGKILYQYKEALFARNTQMKSKLDCIASLGKDPGGRVLTLSYHTPQRGKYKIDQVYIGTGRAAALYQLKKELLPLGAAAVMIVLCAISLCISLYMRMRKMSGGRFRDVALFLGMGSIWLVTDSSLAQSISSSPDALCLVSFYMFMLFAVPMIHFQQKMGNMSRYRILDIGIFSFYCNALVQGILAFLGIAQFKDMLIVTHILLFVWVLILAVLLIREYRREKRKEFLILLIAYIIVSASGISALILYWLFEISYYGAIFELGILVFLVLIIADTVMEMADNIRYRLESQAYERLVQEDGLTGLETRTGFEKALEKISGQIQEYQDILLIYIDINHFRMANEEFGRGLGDEMVIASARCIENVFRGKGTCYRIGGDEFAVLVCDPEEPEEFWLEQLKKEAGSSERYGRCRVSLSVGSSCIRKSDGRYKTIGDWKYEADRKLYENKKKEGKEKSVY